MNSCILNIIYNGIEDKQSFNNNDLMIDVLKKYINKKSIDKEQNLFIANGKKISFEFLKKGRIKAEMYKGKKIIAFNLNRNKNKNINKNYWKLENILCPNCKNLAYITYNDEEITLECKICSSSKKNKYSISEFMDIQYEISFLRCDECKSIFNIYNDSNELYICSNCDKKLCSFCKIQHQEKNENHFINNYKWKYEYCIKHGKPFVNYCNKCNCNFCKEEEKSHEKHDYFLIKKKIPRENSIEELKKKINELNGYIEKYKKELDILKYVFDRVIINMKKNLDNHLKLNNYLDKSLGNINNYQQIKNIGGFAYSKIINNIKNFLNSKMKDKFKYLIEKFYSNKIPYNQIELTYIQNKKKKLDLFNKDFVSRNKENCYLLDQDKIMELSEIYEFKKEANSDFKIIFIALEPIIDMKNMFSDCMQLKSFESYNFDTSKVTNMSNIFIKCKNLINVKGIKDISNVTNLSSMFRECSSLASISNISNWDLSKVKDISYMFSQCSKLEYISEYLLWDTSNITNMSNLFSGCPNLSKLPDISSWNTSNVIDMSHLFCKCRTLKSFPDISKWKTNKIITMSYMFQECVNLEELPDISQWDTSEVEDMSGLLYQCETLKQVPDISKWNTSNVNNMKEMFYFCKSLKDFPNISNWDTSRVKDISSMFEKCKDLENVPNRALFKKKIKDLNYKYDSLFDFNEIERKKTLTNKSNSKLLKEDIDDITLRKSSTALGDELTKSKKRLNN